MASPSRHIDDLMREADVRELVSQLTPHRETRLKNELRAFEIRDRITTLEERLAKGRGAVLTTKAGRLESSRHPCDCWHFIGTRDEIDISRRGA